MNEYQEEIQERGITRLCHFTKSSNLPFILGDGQAERNGILSTNYIQQSSYLEQLDKKRLDGHLDYVCCSVQQVNERYFYIRQQAAHEDLFHQWAIIYISPSIINGTTNFSPVNAATARGANIKSGISAFRGIFADPITYYRGIQICRKIREPNLPANLPTDSQAEVLIKEKVPKDKIIGVAFPEETYKVEKQRLSFCLGKMDIEVTSVKI
ncbi:DUF4433 domain-containing protein [Limosilactobacillus reuteri]|uniref:DarT ssDNA thymidine ADP-ribosyltransferase family protein n=1 Tax=Limosilactobacillus reuteri TaxID=1598 RepID=UPI001E52824C|nr:DarT ssDNA thymidine ADP-ribosyltransferase family protein [Limosilactobacillus reuteri]MCC4383178.1 DUF4433 domain-containing protein [Limosilactobacillus reuteri]MCC4420015.1 DUF4433 domain-containing protein [Limosilactobacillus reuteri]